MGIRGRVRSRGLVHGARAYLAGAGTTGSLLAVAALVFIVASALVAFRGWPHVAAATSPGEVVVSPHQAGSTATLAARRLAFVAGAPGAGGPGRGGAGGAAGAGGRLAPSAAGRGLGQPRPPRHAIGAPASTSVPVSTGGSGSTTCPSGCGTPGSPAPSPTPVQQVQQTLSQATNTLGTVVTDTGSRLGSSVQQTTNGVAGALGGAGTPAGGAVGTVGSGAAKTLGGATQALGGVLKSLGGR
jgi:hypothetical protein